MESAAAASCWLPLTAPGTGIAGAQTPSCNVACLLSPSAAEASRQTAEFLRVRVCCAVQCEATCIALLGLLCASTVYCVVNEFKACLAMMVRASDYGVHIILMSTSDAQQDCMMFWVETAMCSGYLQGSHQIALVQRHVVSVCRHLRSFASKGCRDHAMRGWQCSGG